MRWLSTLVRVGAAAAAAGILAVGAGLLVPTAASGADPSPTSTAVVGFSQSTYLTDEGSKAVTITLQRSGGLPVSALEVDYSTASGTATPGEDYTETRGTASFAVGATTSSFSVAILEDVIVEPTESVTLRVDAVRGDARAGEPATLFIRDDDAAAPGPSATGGSAVATGKTASSGGRAGAAAPAGATTAGGTASSTASATARTAAGGVGTENATAAAPAAVAARGAKSTGRVTRPPTPFELRTQTGDEALDATADDHTRVNPLLALVAGLLVARLAAEVWFRLRTLPS